jgi:hypothetical protein
VPRRGGQLDVALARQGLERLIAGGIKLGGGNRSGIDLPNDNRPDYPTEPVADYFNRALEDRRKQPHVDIALRENGFAVVPAPSSREDRSMRDERAPREMRPPRGDRYPLSLLTPSQPASRLDPAAADYAEAHTDDDDEAERLEAILRFKRARSRRNVPWLVAALAVVVVAAFLLSQTGQALVQSLVHRASPGGSGPSGQTPAQTPEPSRTPVVADNTRASDAPEESGAAQRSPADEPAAADKSAAAERQAAVDTPSRAPAVESAQIERSTRAPNPPAASSTETARASVSRSVPRPAVSAPAPAEHAARLVSPRFAGLPHVELSREPGSAGGTYAVRILDPAGQPMSNAEVLLMARMPDGTVENVRLDFYPDRGTYRGALPPTSSSPMDLRVRVITGDKRVEIPLRP